MIEFLNHHGAAALPYARQMLWQTALLVAALGLLDLLAARRLRSTLRCALWLLVVVKLLLPPSLQLPTGAGFWLGRWLADPVVPRTSAGSAAVVETSEPALSLEDIEPANSAPPPAAVLNLRGGLLLAWIAGALLLGMGLVIRNRPVRQLERGAAEAPQELQAQLHAAVAELGLRRIPRFRLSHANHSPAVCGFFRPIILLPAELAARLSPAGLRAVLLHELMHLRRHDLWVNLLQVVVQVLWWWNPLTWLVNARIRTLREEAVDEAVMLATREDQVAYPATLVEVARHCAARPLLALSFLGIFESRRALHARVVRLLNRPLPVRANLGWSGWVSLLAAALLALPMGFTRRVEASDAVPPASVAPAISPQAASQPALSPALAARYGLAPQGLPATPSPSGAATTVALATETPPASPNGANFLKVTIPADGDRFLLAGKALDAAELKELLKQRAEAAPNLVLSLATEGEVPFARVNEALGAASAAGITRFSLATAAAPDAEARSAGATPAAAVAPKPSPATVTLLTRQFRVDPNTFLKGLEAVLGQPLLPGANGASATNHTREVQVALREFFQAAGVTFPSPTDGAAPPDQARKAVYFIDRAGILYVRATAADLDIVEKAVQALNAAPPQVQLEVKFVELAGDSATGVTWESLTANWVTKEPGATNFTGILTETQFRAALRDLEQRPGVTFLSAPRITTLSGRQARISITEPKAVLDPATGTTNTLDVGPVLDAIPYVGADDHSIQLTVLANVTELLDADVSSPQTPRKQASWLKAAGTLWDGQTLVLGATASGNPRKRLLVFVTPTIIDPAGQRVHDPARLPFDPNSVPPQPK